MKKIYIAGAISSPTLEGGLKNLRQGMMAGAELMKMGYCPFVPHLDFMFGLIQDDLIPVETYYKYDIEWLKSCQCVLVLPNSENSKGVKAELDFALENGIPIFYAIEELIDWIWRLEDVKCP